jgi:hypothetical protein
LRGGLVHAPPGVEEARTVQPGVAWWVETTVNPCHARPDAVMNSEIVAQSQVIGTEVILMSAE